MTIPKPLNYQLKYKVIYVVKEKLFQRLILPVKIRLRESRMCLGSPKRQAMP